ncbi:MAG: hypothetical protein L0L92_10960, partial [Corynebacterium variabile]|nr:hypothetical protein [Corynebacterium variabile]
RAGFFINVPVAVVMVILALRFLPSFETERGRFDLIGAATSVLGMGALVYSIINAGESGWGDPFAIWPMTIGALVLALFMLNEWRARQPILPLRLFASAGRSGAAIARLLFAGTMIAFYFFTTQYFQGVYGWTPLQAGLVNTAHQLGSTLGVAVLTSVAAGASTLSGRVVDAYAGGVVMIAVAVIASLALIVPSEVRSRRMTTPA